MPEQTRRLLRAAAATPGEIPPFEPLWRRARYQRRLRQAGIGLGVAAMGLAAVLGGLATLGRLAPSDLVIMGQPVEPGWPQVRGAALHVPVGDIPQGVTAGLVEDRQVFFVRTGDQVEVILAAAQHLPNEGLWWCPVEQVFASPFHGELFDRSGRALFGPADRDLDRFAAHREGDLLRVDAGSIIAGQQAKPVDSVADALPDNRARAYQQPWEDGFCTGHQPDLPRPTVVDPGAVAAGLPQSARPVATNELDEPLRSLFALDPVAAVFTIPSPVGPDRLVYAIPEADPPLLFGTDCDVVSAVELPVGWLGYCRERTHAGARTASLFPWGTTSTPTANTSGASPSPDSP